MHVDDDLVEFCAREYPRLVGVLSVRCSDRHIAEELAQEALARACSRWTSVRRMNNPTAWVQRVALNLAASWLRRRRAERRALARRGPSVDSSTDSAVTDRLAVREAVLRLPVKQRTILALRFYRQFSVAETAEVMGLTPASVKGHTTRALTALRGHLGPARMPIKEASDE